MQFKSQNIFSFLSTALPLISSVVIISTAEVANAGIVTRQDWFDACRAAGGRVVQRQNPARGVHFVCLDAAGMELTVKTLEFFPGGQGQVDINEEQHDDQGIDPLSAIFTSNTSLSPLPSELNLTLNPNSSEAKLLGPEIWGEQEIVVDVTQGTISASFDQNSNQYILDNFTLQYESFEINGRQSGTNNITQRPNSQSRIEFNSLTGQFDAYVEAQLTNDIYPESNPVMIFSHIEGEIISEFEILITSESDPMIAPGVPGEPPIDRLGMAYIPTIASFDPISNLLSFHDNIEFNQNPDVAIVRNPDGSYISQIGNSESLIGATWQIEPMEFLGQDSSGRYTFADSEFSLFNSNGVFASGTLTNIGFDLYTFGLNADVVLDDNNNPLFSPFVNIWSSNPSTQLLGPRAINALLANTEDLTQAGNSPVDFTNHMPKTSEPSANAKFLLGSFIAFSISYRFRGRIKEHFKANKNFI